MKTIELKMFKRRGRWKFKAGRFGTEYWCSRGFMEYVYVPDVTKMFLLVSDQRPSHCRTGVLNNYFRLGRIGGACRIGGALADDVAWEVSDMPNEPSPWNYRVDKFLDRKFKNKSTLYAWFEYE